MLIDDTVEPFWSVIVVVMLADDVTSTPFSYTVNGDDNGVYGESPTFRFIVPSTLLSILIFWLKLLLTPELALLLEFLYVVFTVYVPNGFAPE